MAVNTVVLDFVTRVGGSLPPPSTTDSPEPGDGDDLVLFASSESARLPQMPREHGIYKRALERWQEIRHPVFLELDERRVIVNLHVPYVGLVVRLIPGDGGVLLVGLSTSAVRFVLSPDHDRFARLAEVLRDAQTNATPMIVTATRRHVILDVRPDDTLRWFRRDLFLTEPVERGDRATAAASRVTRERAQELFDDLNAKTCDVSERPARRCIPFLYPEDGCWARADRMCDLLSGRHNLKAAKVWIHGELRLATENSPFCEVVWDWHVAPALRVGTGATAPLKVLDPAVFARPVSITTWKNALGDPAARVSITEANVYRQVVEGQFTKEAEGQGDFDLDTYGALLAQRVDEDGPPPYACNL